MNTITDIPALFAQAYALQHENKIQEAIAIYQQILSLQADHLDAMRYLGLAYAEANDMTKAIEWFNNALVINPDDATLHMNIGNAYKLRGALDIALEHYQKALQIEPNYAQAYNNLAGIYAQKDQYQDALEAYRSALHAIPSFTQAHFNLGLLLLKHHEIAAAETQFNNVMALDPSHTRALFYLGLLKLKREDLLGAEQIFNQILLVEPENVEVLVNLGVIALKQKKEQIAIDYFTRALALDEHNLEARNNLAATFIHYDRYENALMYYDGLLRDDPNNLEYLYNAGVAEMGLGHLKEATQLFEKILGHQAHHFGALSNLAAIEMRLGHRDTARDLLKRALLEKPDDKTSAFMLEALTGEHKQLPACSTYVHDLFNHYALYYEKHVQDVLHYALPRRVWEVLYQLGCSMVQRGLDLGCGTGLMGMILRPFCKELIGVDLAEKMLAVAGGKNIYDELIQAEIVTFLEQDTEHYQLIVAADVLPYLGDLSELFKAIKPRLASFNDELSADDPNQDEVVTTDKQLFIFTTEISPDMPWQLQESMRFCHHPSYIQALCHEHGLHILVQEKMVARKQEDKDLEVILYAVNRL